ncbi:sporulation integral membrane protein YtvI [Paenibacillus sp. SORGH_AS306]|uniref:AI-2E family transporter n=1 Tax=unclassified Paenibacillus TaxID=185978 RepID=UPI00278B370E|nr:MULTISPECIES: AI-2E family transporter [unclassified Paenibacillus]MDQ1235307.1 sporulation integral membrane protein YtvI [Paenibacillus sp. SORGH_AS_0306]MDR6112356.1 sporulation integral membrane protein YtvI [Paenibacillus sp. SORGH_AS_0338]
MLPLYKKYWRTAFDIGIVVLTVYLVLLLASKLYHIAAPIFLSFIIFALIEPFAMFLNRRGLPKMVCSAIAVLTFVLFLLGALFGAGLIFISQSAQIADNLPEYARIVQGHFTRLTTLMHQELNTLPDNVTQRINEYFAIFTGNLAIWGKAAFNYVLGWLSSFSTFIANFAVGIILAFFLSAEINLWRRVATERTPNTLKKAYFFLKEHVFYAIGAYLKAQLIMVMITFVLVYIGLLILGVNNAFSISLLSAAFDILPLLGIPVIFIPWIVYLFVVGETGLAIGLIVLLVVVMLTRQLLEPKITGNSIGISSAYLMLSAMIISLSIFGVVGLVLSPILIILLKELWLQGYLQRWIRLPKEEFEPITEDVPPPPVQ